MGEWDGRRYQERFDALAAAGAPVHGEADLIASYTPDSVLDAGCGTGRVAIELARRGIDVAGVDVDPSMLDEARRRAPDLEWHRADLAGVQLDRRFAVVVLAGNVPLFCAADRRSDLVARCAAHVRPAGRMIAGFQLGCGYTLEEYDAVLAAAGFALEQRWSTWDRAHFVADGAEYAVSVHRAPAG